MQIQNFFKNPEEDEILSKFIGKLELNKYSYCVKETIAEVISCKSNSLINKKARISSKATIDGPVFIDEGVTIQDFVYIKGPVIILKNSFIGTSSFIRDNCIVGSNTTIGYSCEIANTVILGNTNIGHFNIITTSIIGRYVNFSAYACTSSYILKKSGNNALNESFAPGDKFGSVIGDECQIGAYAMINPGTFLENGCVIYPKVSLKSGYYSEKSEISIKGYNKRIRILNHGNRND